MMSRRLSLIALVLSIVFIPVFTASAFRVIPAALRMEQAPATVETYTLTVKNDTDNTEEVRLYLGDWLRYPDGEHDWDIPPRGARWDVQEEVAAGDTVVIRYRVEILTDYDLEVSGHFRMLKPGLSGPVIGVSAITTAGIGMAPTPPTNLAPWIERTLLGIGPDGMATVQLDIHCPVDCAGITIYEAFSRSVQIEEIDSAGGTFYTVNHSCIDWITLSHTRFTLQPDESQEVQVEVATPLHFSGAYWATIFVESQPRVSSTEGIQIASIYRTAIKVFVTAPGTQHLAGEVTKVAVINTEELEIQFSFANTGNVSLAPAGTIEIIDRSGEVVLSLPIETFYVLPGSYAITTVNSDPLAVGIYQVRVMIDYGGDSLAGGVRAFRVK